MFLYLASSFSPLIEGNISNPNGLTGFQQFDRILKTDNIHKAKIVRLSRARKDRKKPIIKTGLIVFFMT
jgi:hypothetical protein